MLIPAVFYRGGTSRGLFFRARELAPWRADARDRLICAAMGSPDPDGRQIDGLGGGVSSLSKTAIVSPPGEHMRDAPGVAWADDVARAADPHTGWDIVYRFGQVPVRAGTAIDWGSTCGNLLAAAALFAVHYILPREHLARAAEAAAGGGVGGSGARVPVRILQACTGERVIASVPVMHTPTGWAYSDVCDTAIAGVPGTAPGIVIEAPITRSVLPTGRARDVVAVDGRDVPVSVIDAGLPVVFVGAHALGLTTPEFTAPVAVLDADARMHAAAERVRQHVGHHFGLGVSPSAPKICLVHPRVEYATSGGDTVSAGATDLLVRAISVGNVHRSVPATTLAALAASTAFPESVVGDAIARGGAAHQPSPATRALLAAPGPTRRAVTAGHPAGGASASVTLAHGAPAALMYTRTARRIMHGLVDVPTPAPCA